MRTVSEIIDDGGGVETLAEKLELTPSAVAKWRGSGIPEAHWAKVRKLCNATPEELHAVNEALRKKQQRQTAA